MANNPTNPSPKELMAKLHEMAQGKKLVLHLGCGVPKAGKLDPRFKPDEWFEVRCDIDARAKPLIVADIRKLHMFPDGAVDAIWNSHVIEHLLAHEVVPAIKEWRRVLKESGLLAMTLPDLQAVATHIAHGRLEDALYTSPAGPISALDVVYGYGPDLAGGNHFMAHRTGFTAATLGKKLADAGFTNIEVKSAHLALWAAAIKPAANDNRQARVRIIRDKDAAKPPPEPPLSVQRHPGALWNSKRPDELDVPPTPLT